MKLIGRGSWWIVVATVAVGGLVAGSDVVAKANIRIRTADTVASSSTEKISATQPGDNLWTYPGAPPGTVYFPHDGFRLEPAASDSVVGAKLNSSDQALAFLKKNVPVPGSSDITEPGPSVAFGYFTNDVSGTIQVDGSVKLIDAHELAWLFTWKLARDFVAAYGPVDGNPSHPHGPGECIFFGFVTTDATIPVAGQDCGLDSVPAVLVKEP